MPHGTESSTLISSCITVSFHILGGSQINSISRRRFSEECISPASTTTSMAHTVPKSEYSRFLSRHLDNPTSNTSLTKRANLTTRRPRRQELPEDKKKQLKDAFDLFDTEKQGSIDYHELKILMRALGFTVSKQRVLDLVNEVDVHRNGRVTFSDYMEIMRREVLARDPDEEITKAFQLFDEDGSGKINLRKMRRVAKELGETLDDEELQAMIDEFDENQDGEIDLDEFRAIMKESDDL